MAVEEGRGGCRPARYVKEGSAADLLLAVLGAGASPVLYAYSLVHPAADDARREYYRPVLFEASCAAGYVSSTVAAVAARRGLSLGRAWSEEGRLHAFTVPKG